MRFSVSVPDELGERFKQHKSLLSPSAIFQIALSKAIDDIESGIIEGKIKRIEEMKEAERVALLQIEKTRTEIDEARRELKGYVV